MKVKMNSWHYRFNDFVDPINPNNSMTLCKYFWMTVWHLFSMTFVIVIIASFVFKLIQLMFFTKSGLIFTGLIIVAFGIGYVLMKIVVKMSEYSQGKKLVKQQKTNLIREYVKSYKRKVCPIIEFVDDNKK